MKTFYSMFLLIMGTSCLFASDLEIESYYIKSDFPHSAELLNQTRPHHEGKPFVVPYQFCGTLTDEDVAKYADFNTGKNHSKASPIILPNGANCSITQIPYKSENDADSIRVKILISGPKTWNAESEMTVYPGNNLIFRVETETNAKSPRLILLKIAKKS